MDASLRATIIAIAPRARPLDALWATFDVQLANAKKNAND